MPHPDNYNCSFPFFVQSTSLPNVGPFCTLQICENSSCSKLFWYTSPLFYNQPSFFRKLQTSYCCSEKVLYFVKRRMTLSYLNVSLTSFHLHILKLYYSLLLDMYLLTLMYTSKSLGFVYGLVFSFTSILKVFLLLVTE